MRDLDPAFRGAGQNPGIEIWRIENFNPVPVPESSHGKFFTGDSYVILKTTALKSGALHLDIHYWLGSDTTQDEAGAAAIKAIELDTALGGCAVQYREVQGHETEKFLSYFKPCIIPQEGGVASGFKHAEVEEHQTRMYVCKGKHVVHVKEVPFARSSLNHDDIFILDTKSKIFQFNGSNSSIQERAKALEVVQYVKDTYHDGKCEIATIEDGKLMANADSGEFWGLFGGFAPLPRKTNTNETESIDATPYKLFCVEKGEAIPVEADSLTRELLDSNKCYILDCGIEVFVWMGRNTTLEERKTASGTADELLHSLDRSKSHLIRVIEGFETVMFCSKFDSWPQSNVTMPKDGRGKVAALLKRQGVNVKGLVKEESSQEEPQLYIDCTGDLQVWHVIGQQKTLLPATDQSKFYSGDCYIFQYSYPGEEREEYLIGTWFGNQSVEVEYSVVANGFTLLALKTFIVHKVFLHGNSMSTNKNTAEKNAKLTISWFRSNPPLLTEWERNNKEDRVAATSQASKMVEVLKFLPTQARFHEGSEPIQFFVIFQSFFIFKGGLSDGYKNYIAEKELPDDTYSEDGLALFQVQGSGPENMQAIQVEPVASSLNSSYCYILHSGSTVFNWLGNLTTSEDQELVDRQLDIIKPNAQSRLQKEGAESDQFWDLLGGKSEYPSNKIAREAESDPHLFSCTLSNGDLKVTEVHNFNQDDLMTEDIFILDCHSAIYVWVGKDVESKNKMNALDLGQKFLERDFLLEKLSMQSPIYVVMEGSEPAFFTRFFSWNSKKCAMHGNSFERKLAILKHGGTPVLDKPRRRIASIGRSAAPEKSQRSRSVCFSDERVRVRGRSPAFNALASKFENPNARNLSTPPPMVSKPFPKSATQDSGNLSSRSESIEARSSSFEKPASARQFIIPRSVKASPEVLKPETVDEDVEEEGEDNGGLPVYPYDCLKTSSTDPVSDIDVTKREAYMSSVEFQEKFSMTKKAFYKLPKWKQNKLKMTVELF